MSESESENTRSLALVELSTRLTDAIVPLLEGHRADFGFEALAGACISLTAAASHGSTSKRGRGRIVLHFAKTVSVMALKIAPIIDAEAEGMQQ